MIIAVTLFLFAIACGYKLAPLYVLAAALLTSVTLISIWIVTEELNFFSYLVLVGNVAALQSGYLLGLYLRPD